MARAKKPVEEYSLISIKIRDWWNTNSIVVAIRSVSWQLNIAQCVTSFEVSDHIVQGCGLHFLTE